MIKLTWIIALSSLSLFANCNINGQITPSKVFIFIEGTNAYQPEHFKLVTRSSSYGDKKSYDKEIKYRSPSPFIELLDKLEGAVSSDVQYGYFRQRDLKSIILCYDKLEQTHREIPIYFFAYSWGANTFFKLLKKIKEVNIAGAFILDPVRKGPGVTKNFIGVEGSKFFIHRNSFPLYNIYQQADKSSLHGIPLRGNAIKNAFNVKLDTYLQEAHIQIAQAQETEQLFNRFLELTSQ